MFTIQNDALTLTIDPIGAQMTRLTGADGTEYLWGGDSAYWGKHAPNLFPVIGRLYEGRCTVKGQEYPMPRHGFANVSLFTAVEQGTSHITLELRDTAESREKFPFPFVLQVGYALADSTLTITYRVENPGTEVMSFALGGHPAFNVPLCAGETFEDYALEFDAPCRPDRVGFTEAEVLLSGQDTPYPLEGGRVLPLKHELFDEDAIILRHAAQGMTLRSRVSGRGIQFRHTMPYLGLWHPAKTDAPFLCIEPWSSLPGRDGVVEELTCRGDFVHLAAGETYQSQVWITCG